jgi:hypothetical protein
MNRPTSSIAIVAAILLSIPAAAHPSSGIVVDNDGNVFIADLSRGLIKIDPAGKVSTINKEAGHWLALDPEGAFANVDFTKSPHWPRWFKLRTPAGQKPALLTDGGSPLVVGPDKNLYYVCGDDNKFTPGGHLLARLSPEGKESLFTPNLSRTSEELGGIKGLALGPENFFYLSYPKAILKVSSDGKVATIANPITPRDCDKHPQTITDAPGLRGLAVDAKGNVYAAATGCRLVLKITPGKTPADARVQTILKSEPPWSPSGVALHNDTLYILEQVNANSEAHEDWPPRVRKLTPDGKVTTLFEVARAARP